MTLMAKKSTTISKRKPFQKPKTPREKECFKNEVSKGFGKYKDSKFTKKKKLAVILSAANKQCLNKKTNN